MKYDIFISYRRKGGYETAKHLYDLFSKDGYRVSFDLDTLRNGDFDQALLKRIDQCSDFILILSKGAFARTLDPAFNPRQDWLRIELAYALKKQKNIIPILLEGFEGFPENLPADIKDVAKKNGPQYNQYYFDEFYKKLKTDFLETRKSRFFSLKTILILSALILCAGGIWWYLQEVSGKQCILSKNNTINKSDTLKTESPDSPATPLTSGKEKKDPATPEQNTKKSQDVQPVTSVKLPDWMFAPTQKFIGIAPASLPARGAKEFAVATAAYQWVIAQGKPISGRDTTIESADVKKSHFHLFTPQIAFEYKIEHETQLSSGERVFEIVFFNSKRNPNTLQVFSSIIDEKNNFEQTIKINYTGFEQIKTYEFNIVDEEGLSIKNILEYVFWCSYGDNISGTAILPRVYLCHKAAWKEENTMIHKWCGRHTFLNTIYQRDLVPNKHGNSAYERRRIGVHVVLLQLVFLVGWLGCCL